MSDVTHTPTPWVIGRYGDVVNSTDGDNILVKGFALTNRGEAVANSALIVAAVNSYASSQAEIERLRTALKLISDEAEAADAIGYGWEVARAVARAALSGSKDK